MIERDFIHCDFIMKWSEVAFLSQIHSDGQHFFHLTIILRLGFQDAIYNWQNQTKWQVILDNDWSFIPLPIITPMPNYSMKYRANKKDKFSWSQPSGKSRKYLLNYFLSIDVEIDFVVNGKLVVVTSESSEEWEMVGPDFEVFRCVAGFVICQAWLVSDVPVLEGNVVKLFPNFLFSIKLILQFSK